MVFVNNDIFIRFKVGDIPLLFEGLLVLGLANRYTTTTIPVLLLLGFTNRYTTTIIPVLLLLGFGRSAYRYYYSGATTIRD